MVNQVYEGYLACLCRWIPFSRKHVYYLPDHPELACYGTGFDEWGIQTCQKAFSAYAVLAKDPNTDEKACGMTKAELLSDALAMLRYILRTHIVGDIPCNDNIRWGHTWLTSVGTERMMHAVDAIWEDMTAEDHALLRKVLISESDWLLENYPVKAGFLPPDNRPESSIWNGSIMLRTALYYPDAPHAEAFREKALKFLVNGFSQPQDAASTDIYDGKRVCDLYVGPNFFRSFALGHHHYMNIGYIIISVSQIAMLHYCYKKRGLKAPEVLYRHLEDAWKMMKFCTFPDGRLYRPGGDNRVRYCYCQDYTVPSWVFMGDEYNDPDCPAWEYQWLQKVREEMDANGDGSFLSARCGELDGISPLYYTRLESDRACSFSYGVYWHRLIGKDFTKPELPMKAITGDWHDDYHGASVVKSEKRTASWVWRAGELPTGVCVPTHHSDLAEWRENLSGSIHGLGLINEQEYVTHQDRCFPGGFVTSGITAVFSNDFAAEGQHKEILAYKDIAAAVLPDDESMIVIQYAKTPMRAYMTHLKGIYLNVPNDIYNGCTRTYYTEKDALRIDGAPGKKETVDLGSEWVNIDDAMSLTKVYGEGSLTVNRPGKRQIGIKRDRDASVDGGGSGDIGMLYCDEICAPYYEGRIERDRGSVLLDNAFVVKAGVTHQATEAWYRAGGAEAVTFENDGLLRGVAVTGADGNRYALIANFDDCLVHAAFAIPGTGEKIKLDISGQTALLLSEKANWQAL